LIGVVAGSGLVAQHQRQLDAQATHTAQTAGTGNANATAQAQARATAAARAAAAATATAVFTIPTATGTAALGDDVTTPPPPPDGAGTLVLSDPAPTCDQPIGPHWTTDNATKLTCDSAGHTVVTAQSSSQSACIGAMGTVIKDGYFSVIANPQSGAVILAFRQSNGQSNGTTVNIAGYLFQVDRANGTYGLFKLDAAEQVTTIKQGSLPGPLAQHFAVGALFKGGTLSLYINGQPLDTATDATFTQGWVGLCTDGTTTYRDVQAYSAAG
ncbi:MAG: hypothetical protein IVW57_04810, partial [Ktedonobacterales bacterium]|nr:hypothetical protein [Ktedonobacterales bacterium]